MKNSTETGWSKLPTEIVSIIINYVPKEFKLNLRLVNKCCYRIVSSELFRYLKIDKPNNEELNAIEKYAKMTKYLENKRIGDILVDIYAHLFLNLHEIYWILDKQSLFLFTKALNFGKHVKKVTVRTIHNGDIYNNDWDVLWECFSNLKRVNELIAVVPFCSCNMFNNVKIVSSLTSLYISIKLDDLPKLQKLLINFNRLTRIEIDLVYYRDGFYEAIKDITVDDFLALSKVKHFHLNFNRYSETSLALDFYYSKIGELIYNSKLSGLHSFGFTFDMAVNGLNDHIFHQFSSHVAYSTPKFYNLARLSLLKVDSKLMRFIIYACPNLEDLKLHSEFICPDTQNLHTLLPLYKLTKLEFNEFEENIDYYCLTIRSLFPSVVKVKYNQKERGNDYTYNSLNLIHLLFPNIITLHLNINNFNFSTLFKLKSKDINWENLFIYQKIYNYYSMKKIIKNLPKLKLLYLPYKNFAYYQNKFTDLEFKLFNICL